MPTTIDRVSKSIGCLIALLLAASSLQVSALTLLDDNRHVFNANDDGSSTFTPASPFADWSSGFQTSTVAPGLFQGVGSGIGESDFFFSIWESTFDVTFHVDSASQIDLQGALTGEDGTFGFGAATVTLYAGATTADMVLYSNFGGSGDFVNFSFFDTLVAGDYRLILTTLITPGGFDTTAEWTFSASFTPVPVPAMGWLLGVVLIGMVRVRKSNTSLLR